MAYGLMVGQATLMLTSALVECYVSLRAGRDLRAGLWLSLLLIKPQYGLIIGPLLLWKRRRSAVAGVAIGAAAIAAAPFALLLLGCLGALLAECGWPAWRRAMEPAALPA